VRLLKVDREHPEAGPIAAAAAALRAGELVAFPTETVYGLGALALDERAVARIFAAKGRPADNPLIAHVSDAAGARELAARWPELAERLAERFWPGPLTLVVPRAPHLPGILTAGLDTVAVRVPGHPVAAALLRAVGEPVAAPSANRFTRVSPTTAAHVTEALGEAVSVVLDAGPVALGIESAVVDVSGPLPLLLRPGTITRGQIEEVAGPLGEASAGGPRRSPGQHERHYAPRARLRLVATHEEARAAAAEEERAGGRPVVLGIGWTLPGVPLRRLPESPAGYARALYATLHELDAMGHTAILVEPPPSDPAWEGVRDRLRRAAREVGPEGDAE
jgi:L-threonylcarbamoyladenylate synthase